MHCRALALQLDADRGREMTEVVGEPRREVVRLVVPRLARINRIQCSRTRFRSSPGRVGWFESDVEDWIEDRRSRPKTPRGGKRGRGDQQIPLPFPTKK